MTLERRLGAGMLEQPTDDPGLALDEDGVVWLVDPDGARTQLQAGGGGGAGALSVSQKVLQPVDLLALHTSPATLIDAPGDGEFLLVLHMAFRYHFVFGTDDPYVIFPNVLRLKLGTPETLNMANLRDVLEGNTDKLHTKDVFSDLYYDQDFDPDDVGGRPLTLDVTNADPTGGTATLTVTSLYYVLDLTL